MNTKQIEVKGFFDVFNPETQKMEQVEATATATIYGEDDTAEADEILSE